MSVTSDYPFEPQPGGAHGGSAGPASGPGSGGASVLSSVLIVAGSVLIGLAGGFAWTALAPRALYVVVGRGSANVVNPETTAFIAADAWYCLIGVAGGLIIGLAGYLAVRRYGPAPMAAILAGSVIAGIAARWAGEHRGLHRFDRQLLTTHQGTLLHAPLALAGDTSAAVWPTSASLPAMAFWPLAACAAAGGILLVTALRQRSARPHGPLHAGMSRFPFNRGQ
jgi:hypothetical protein